MEFVLSASSLKLGVNDDSVLALKNVSIGLRLCTLFVRFWQSGFLTITRVDGVQPSVTERTKQLCSMLGWRIVFCVTKPCNGARCFFKQCIAQLASIICIVNHGQLQDIRMAHLY